MVNSDKLLITDSVNCFDEEAQVDRTWTVSPTFVGIPTIPLCVDCISEIDYPNEFALSPVTDTCSVESLKPYTDHFVNETTYDPTDGIIRIVEVKFRDPIPAPLIYFIEANATTKSTIDVNVTAEYNGLVYCAAYEQGISPLSSEEIISYNFYNYLIPNTVSLQFENPVEYAYSNTTNSNYALNTTYYTVNASTTFIKLTNLIPLTSYTVYCVSLSTDDIDLSLEDSIEIHQNTTTKCCKEIVVQLETTSVRPGKQIDGSVTVSIDYAPNSDLEYTLFTKLVLPDIDPTIEPSSSPTLYPTMTNNTTNTTSIRRYLVESNSIFPPNSKVSRAYGGPPGKFYQEKHSFTGLNSVGTYSIDITVTGNSSWEYDVGYGVNDNKEFVILHPESPTPLPVPLFAQFSNDGTNIVVKFDSDTNRAGFIRKFSCSKLFNVIETGEFINKSFIGNCQWILDNSIIITPGPSTFLNVGDKLVLLHDKLSAKCGYDNISCDNILFVGTTNIEIIAPISPFIPIGTISAPSSIGSCNSLTLDMSGSVGSGGRPWKIKDFVVEGINASAITDFLYNEYIFNPPTPIHRSYFTKGSVYEFKITLCNFLGPCTNVNHKLLVLNSIFPTITIIGTQTRTYYTSDLISVSALGSIVDCDGKSSTLNLRYSWKVFLDGIEQKELVSISKDPSKFKLDAFSLKKSTYTYVIKGTVVNTVSFKSTITSVKVNIVSNLLVANIYGGSSQQVRLGDNFTFDASGSYDKDQINFGSTGLTYTWSCFTSLPFYSEACGVYLYTHTTDSSILLGFADTPSTASTISLTVSDGIRSVKKDVIVSVNGIESPKAPNLLNVGDSDGSITSKLSVNSQISLSGNVDLLTSGSTQWSVDDPSIDLNEISLSSPIVEYYPKKLTTYKSRIVLLPNTLPEGKTLTFSLKSSITGTDFSATSQMVVVTNGPPVPGLFTVDPSFGYANSDKFTFIVSNWKDEDLPITYSFSFTSISGSQLTFKSRSEGSFISSALPIGISDANYTLSANAKIFDSLNSNYSISVGVRVFPPIKPFNITEFGELSLQESKEASGNIDAMKTFIALTSSVLNTVNCTGAADCESINRQKCSRKSNTCGPCLSEDFVGFLGHSNMACQNISSIYLANNKVESTLKYPSCSESQDCSLGESCNPLSNQCEQQCTETCSERGTCYFINVYSRKEVPTCLGGSASCTFACHCDLGFSGQSCSMTNEELEQKQVLRTNMLITMSEVTSLEDSDPVVVGDWITSLDSLSSEAAELSVDTGGKLIGVADSILDSAISSDMTFDESIGLLNVLDSVITFAVNNKVEKKSFNITNNSSSGTDSKVFSDTVVVVDDVFDKMSAMATQDMVPGQSPITLINQDFRLKGVIAGDGSLEPIIEGESSRGAFTGNSSEVLILSLPATKLEAMASLGRGSSRIELPGITGAVGVVEKSASLLTTIPDSEDVLGPETIIAADGFSSNSQRVTYHGSNDICSSEAKDTKTTFLLQHNEPQVYGPVESDYENFTTTCEFKQPVSYTYFCPIGVEMEVACNGTESVINSLCPQRTKLPNCNLVGTSSGTTSEGCYVTSYSTYETVCECSICDPTTGELRIKPKKTKNSIGIMEAVAIASYTASEFINILKSAGNFNSLEALLATQLILEAFAGLWFTTLLMVYLSELREKSFIIAGGRRKKESKTLLGAINKKKSGFVTERDVQESLKAYVSNFFPHVFSDKTQNTRLFYEITRHHKYFSVFGREIGIRKWLGSLEILTFLTFYMFVLAILYDIQFPADDGSCSLNTSADMCISSKSMFDQNKSKCGWTINDLNGDCSWIKPQSSARVLIIISVILIIISAPINALLSYIFNNILLAPTASEIRKEAKIISGRRNVASMIVTLQKDTVAMEKAKADSLQKGNFVKRNGLVENSNVKWRQSNVETNVKKLRQIANKSMSARNHVSKPLPFDEQKYSDCNNLLSDVETHRLTITDPTELAMYKLIFCN
jgi:hypothetical protein